MMFTIFKKIKVQGSKESIFNQLQGQQFSIHKINFETYLSKDSPNKLKIIPHAEFVTRTTTLPITSVEYKSNNGSNYLKLNSHMRKIDKGLPMFVLILIFGLFGIGLLTWIFGDIGKHNTAYTMMCIGGVLYLLLYIRMHIGYYDYVRKTKSWIKSKINA